MSSEINDIGMDLHKETTSIAVLTGGGELVMESIIETKGSPFCSSFRFAGKVAYDLV